MDDYNTTYNLPDELVSDPKIFKFMPIKTLLMVILFVFIGTTTQGAVYTPLQMPYVIFNGVVGFVLSLPSPVNLQKKIYNSVFIELFSDKRYYAPVPDTRKYPVTLKQYERWEDKVVFTDPSENG